MLGLDRTGPDVLFDALLPEEARLLPGELAALDGLLRDPRVLEAFAATWRKAGADGQVVAVDRGRPTMAMSTYVRLMVLKHRSGFGYETLMAAVADSLHLRRFCQIPLTAPVPDESTIRKRTRRLGSEPVDELTRTIIEGALAQKKFRPRALRADSTVAAADIRYPTDSGLCADSVRVLARVARRVAAVVPKVTARVRDRSRAVGRRQRALSRTLRRRSGEAKAAHPASDRGGCYPGQGVGCGRPKRCWPRPDGRALGPKVCRSRLGPRGSPSWPRPLPWPAG